MKSDETIYSRLKASRSLPSPPQVLLKLLDACHSQHASPREIADIVFKDPSLSARILQLVNSSFMGFREKIHDLDKAIVYLGIDTLKNLAVSAAVFQVFGKAQSDVRFNLHHFWWHALLVGTLAKRIARKIGYASTDEAFLSGMLHDIGKLIFWVNFREQYTLVLKEAGEDEPRLIALEKELGASHVELGAWMAQQWRLNPLMADAILYHHDPMDRICESFPLVKIVFFAECLASPEDPLRLQETAEALFTLSAGDVAEIRAGATEEVAETARALGIPADPPEARSLEAVPAQDPSGEHLADTVQTLSLLYGVLQNLLRSGDQKSILKASAQGFRILLGIPHLFFFIADPEKNTLAGRSFLEDTDSAPEEDLILSCDHGKSLLSRSFMGQEAYNSLSMPGGSPSIADEQILRLLSTEGMVYLPLAADGDRVGVVALGVSPSQAEVLSERRMLVDLLAAHTGMCLHMHGLKTTHAGRIQTERLEASATVARKVVHEVNNPLGIIKNYLKILSLKLPERHPAQTELSVISEEIDRVSEIVQSLKDYAVPTARGRETVDLNLLVQNILSIADHSLLKPAGIKLHFTPDDAAPPFRTDKNGIKQVLLNLIKNAAEAMPDGGALRVGTRFSPPPGGDTDGPGREIQICIADNGPGIPEEITARLFEPFHTTKQDGHSGLGLSIVRNIIKELGGTISCESSPQTGTTFTITLPTASEEPEHPGG